LRDAAYDARAALVVTLADSGQAAAASREWTHLPRAGNTPQRELQGEHGRWGNRIGTRSIALGSGCFFLTKTCVGSRGRLNQQISLIPLQVHSWRDTFFLTSHLFYYFFLSCLRLLGPFCCPLGVACLEETFDGLGLCRHWRT
jgi:hypothetical protein